MSTRFIQGTPVNYQGRTDGVAVPAGMVGEQRSASPGNVTLSVSGTVYDAASLTLTAGVWVVYGKAAIGVAGSTQTQCNASISTVPGALNLTTLVRDLSTGVGSNRLISPAPLYVNTTGTTVYLTAEAVFTGTAPATIGAQSLLYAVRIA